jgi:hypothetical protein
MTPRTVTYNHDNNLWKHRCMVVVVVLMVVMHSYNHCICYVMTFQPQQQQQKQKQYISSFMNPYLQNLQQQQHLTVQRTNPVKLLVLLQQSSSPTSSSSSSTSTSSSSSSSSILNNNNNNNNNTPNIQFTIMKPNQRPSIEWEMDCYSRPVIMKDDNNKKLWQILITDSLGTFQYIHRLPSNQVNSKTLKTIIENLIDNISTMSEEYTNTSNNNNDYYNDYKPTMIRFFRGAMFNMIQIALSDIPNISSKPSRCTFALASWLEELHTTVYPQMEGYNGNLLQQQQSSSNLLGSSSSSSSSSFLDVRTPIKLPDALRGEKYAFVSLPIQEFLVGGSITNDNIGVGRLCPIPSTFVPTTDNDDTTGNIIGADTFVQGIVILSSRAPALAAWLAGTEVVAIQADIRKRIVTMETDIDNQYLMAKLNDQQRIEAIAFEEGKDLLKGLHFVSVQNTEDDDPEGFWLLRELPNGI